MSQLESTADSRPGRASEGSRVLSIDAGEATGVFDCLSPATARHLLATLHEEPRTASELAETVDTSIQNVQYHLEKFQNGHLVEVVGTEYSSRGVEMDVYAPTTEALILYGGQHDPADDSLQERLTDALAALGLLAVLSLVVEGVIALLFRRMVRGDAAPGDGGIALPEPVVLDIGGVAVSGGLAFFTGGLFVLGCLAALSLRSASFPAPARGLRSP